MTGSSSKLKSRPERDVTMRTAGLLRTAALPRTRPAILLGATALLATFIASGCKSVHWSKADFNREAKAAAKEGNPFGEPVKMVAIWRDAVYESDNGPMSRGFGGRFYFYDEEQKPVRVEGELVVYAYDDSARMNTSEADRKYVFRAEDLQQHYSETALGPSYSFWLPWDRIGGPSLSIALIPVLKSGEGKLVRGNQSLNVLPGKSLDGPPRAGQASSGDARVQPITSGWQPDRETARQVAYLDDEPKNVVTTGHEVRTTTIDVPAETAARMPRGQPSSGPSGGDPAASPEAGESRFSQPGIRAAVPAEPAVETSARRNRPESPWAAFRPLADVRNPSDKPPLDTTRFNKTR